MKKTLTQGKNEVFLQYKAPNPVRLTVTVGTTISFINKDNANHAAISNGGVFDCSKITSSNSYSYTFSTAGTYYFYCKYHSSISQEQGVILVQ